MKNDGTAVAPPRGGGVTAVASPHVHEGARRPPPEVQQVPCQVEHYFY